MLELECPSCGRPSPTKHLDHAKGIFVCSICLGCVSGSGCNLFEYGHENPKDPEGSTAHVRDIKDRRWHPTEKRLFYYSKELGKTYSIPKG